MAENNYPRETPWAAHENVKIPIMRKIVKVGNVECGADQLFLIAGPCVVEDEKTMMDTAEFLVGLSEKLHLPLIFKSSFQKDNRSSADFYSGPGIEKGLAMLQKIKEQFNVPILTDIHYPEQIAATAEVADVGGNVDDFDLSRMLRQSEQFDARKPTITASLQTEMMDL